MPRTLSIRFIVCLLALFSAGSAAALRTDDITVVFPIVGRFPGAGGTQWRTEVFISNHSTISKSVEMTFYVAGGSPVSRTAVLSPFSTESFPDIVLNTFGLTTASGELQLTSSNESAIEARARIFNAGNAAGEFGQSVPALGMKWLGRQAYLYGLSGITGSRINVGVTNPNPTEADVTMRITDKNNAVLHVESMTLQPHQNVQFNDIFRRFGIPLQGDVQVEFNTSELRIYGYASDVRNDTGDAIFIAGTAPNV